MIPSFPKYLYPFLQVMASGDVMNIGMISEKIAKFLKLTNEDLEIKMESGQSRHINRCSWAKTWFYKAGLINSPKRAYFVISDEGRKLYNSDVDDITQKFLVEHYPSFAEFAAPKIKDAPIDISHENSSLTAQEQRRRLTAK